MFSTYGLETLLYNHASLIIYMYEIQLLAVEAKETNINWYLSYTCLMQVNILVDSDTCQFMDLNI